MLGGWRSDGRGSVVCDNAVWSVRAVLLQAFNTETTKNHGAARSGSDDKSPRAVFQQPRLAETEQQADAKACRFQIIDRLHRMHTVPAIEKKASAKLRPPPRWISRTSGMHGPTLRPALIVRAVWQAKIIAEDGGGPPRAAEG